MTEGGSSGPDDREPVLAKVTAVFVDFHQADNVVRGITSLLQQYDPSRLDIVVVDNSACPRNAERLRAAATAMNVRLIVNGRNLGYGLGCNLGAAAANSEFVLLVNPDIQWNQAGVLERMVSFLKARPAAAIVAPGQVNEDGSQPLTVRQFPTMLAQVLRRTSWRDRMPLARIVGRYEAAQFDYGRTQPAWWVQSSCMLVRRTFWDAIGGFDCRFFLFMADVDLCREAWKEGWEVWYLADCRVTANGRRASAGGPRDLLRNPALRRHVIDAGRYYWKYAATPPPRGIAIDAEVTLLPSAAAPEATSRQNFEAG